MRKSSLLLNLFAFSIGMISMQAPAQQSPLQRVFAECRDFTGAKVEYREDKAQSPMMAQAGADARGPYILFNLRRLQSLELESAIWVVRHECGHHQLGHFSTKNRNTPQRQMEFEADCFAAKEARRIGLNLNGITKELGSFFKEDADHPAPQARVDMIVRCYNSGR